MSVKLAKVVLVGAQGVGKTSVVNRYVNNEYDDDSGATIGVEFSKKTVDLDCDSVTLQIWDSSGQERFAAVARSVNRGAQAFILFASHNSAESLAKLKELATSIVDTVAGANARAVLVLTKNDDPSQSVSVADAASLIPELKALGLHFISEDPFSISVKNDHDASQVAPIFSLVAADCANRMNAEVPAEDEGSDKEDGHKHAKKAKMNYFGFKV